MSDQQTPFDPRRALSAVVTFGLVGAALVVVNAATGLGVPCPFRMLTGWNCPLCGSTRMGTAMLRGDVSAAFAVNPLTFVGLLVLAVCSVAWLVEVLGGPAWRPLRRWGGFSQGRLYTVVGVSAALFAVARNLL